MHAYIGRNEMHKEFSPRILQHIYGLYAHYIRDFAAKNKVTRNYNQNDIVTISSQNITRRKNKEHY
jgi:hypothetical protein